MKQSLQIAKALVKLIGESELPASRFSKNETLINNLKSLGVISVESKGRGKVISKGNYFKDYVARNYNGEPELFLSVESRGELVSVYGDDKAMKISPQQGLFLWSEKNIPLTVSTFTGNEEGVVTFIHERVKISIPDDVTIVGVENFESLTYAIHLKKNFSLPDKCLFAYRNLSFNKLIMETALDVLYIPDYDIYGIRIFETEILKNNPSTKMLFPNDIEKVFARIDTSKKYFEQSQMVGAKYDPVTKDGKYIASLIRRYKRIIPQEYFHYAVD